MSYLMIFITAIFVNNIVLSQFLGICPFLGVSKKISTAAGMGGAVTFVMVLSTIVTYIIYHAVLLPYVMEFNAPCTGTKFREIARAMGVKNVDKMKQAEYREAAIKAVKKLKKDVNIPKTLKEIGVKKEDLEALAEAAMADVCTGGNPRPCTKELVLEVYKKAFNGK